MKRIISIFILITSILTLHTAYAIDKSQTEINKQIVIEFYDQLINQKNFEAATQYLGSPFIQHNPVVLDGVEGVKEFIQFLQTKHPNAHSDIKKIFADKEYVFVHVHSIREPGTRGRAIFDLFKLENGKIIEHWDTIQDIPVDSANDNGMF